MMNLNELDKQTPGGVYLCQVSDHISCGACCGLYNVADVSRDALMSMLTWRTNTFQNVPRELDAILEFRRSVEIRENSRRPFPDFHHCPYIGLVGEDRSRVGCLLHPLADGNNGVDFRGISFHGGMACRVYFCPTCRDLPPVYKEIVREVSDDWYLYGLVITETTLLQAFFGEIENRIQRPLNTADIIGHSGRMDTVREFLALKLDWPFRSDPGNGVCHYFFEEDLYPRPLVNYDAAGMRPSCYDVILRELVSRFDCLETLKEAEARLDCIFEKVTRPLL